MTVALIRAAAKMTNVGWRCDIIIVLFCFVHVHP